MIKKMGKEYYRLGFDKGFVNAGAFAPLMGGHPDECPERYALFSPVTHVHLGCPLTLLIHGEHDIMAPVKSTRLLHSRLIEKKVKTVMHILPQTDHAFDLQLPQISPSAHSAFYDVERFLALKEHYSKEKGFTKSKMIRHVAQQYPELYSDYNKEQRNRNSYYAKMFEAIALTIFLSDYI